MPSFLGAMVLPLSKVPPEGCDFAFDVAANRLAGAAEALVGHDPIRVTGRAEHEAGGLRVRGRVETRLALECSRCLGLISQPFDSRLDVLYSRRVSDEDEVELSGVDLAVCVLEGDAVNLFELVREQVLLEVPMAPLCSGDCKGLCPRCKANLSAGPCACPEPVDPRLRALKKLL